MGTSLLANVIGDFGFLSSVYKRRVTRPRAELISNQGTLCERWFVSKPTIINSLRDIKQHRFVLVSSRLVVYVLVRTELIKESANEIRTALLLIVLLLPSSLSLSSLLNDEQSLNRQHRSTQNDLPLYQHHCCKVLQIESNE